MFIKRFNDTGFYENRPKNVQKERTSATKNVCWSKYHYKTGREKRISKE